MNHVPARIQEVVDRLDAPRRDLAARRRPSLRGHRQPPRGAQGVHERQPAAGQDLARQMGPKVEREVRRPQAAMSETGAARTSCTRATWPRASGARARATGKVPRGGRAAGPHAGQVRDAARRGAGAAERLCRRGGVFPRRHGDANIAMYRRVAKEIPYSGDYDGGEVDPSRRAPSSAAQVLTGRAVPRQAGDEAMTPSSRTSRSAT